VEQSSVSNGVYSSCLEEKLYYIDRLRPGLNRAKKFEILSFFARKMTGCKDNIFICHCCNILELHYIIASLHTGSPGTMAPVPPLVGDNVPPAGTGEKGKKQKSAPAELPVELDGITTENMFERCVVVDEMLPNKKTGECTGPHKVASVLKYVFDPPESETLSSMSGVLKPIVWLEYELKDLTIDQIRFLLKKLCVKGYCSATKFNCRMLLLHQLQFEKFYNQETIINSNSN
jgi:hypothetical protein